MNMGVPLLPVAVRKIGARKHLFRLPDRIPTGDRT
jgi:hypothetical protein